MNSASVTFQNQQSDKVPYIISTVCDRNTIDLTASPENLIGTRGVFEEAMALALNAGQGRFPAEQAAAMLAELKWGKGFPLLLDSNPSLIKFIMDDETSRLLPELLPRMVDRNQVGWLDTLAPSCRTLSQVEEPQVRRVSENKLAVLYQHGDPFFEELAHDIQRDLFHDFTVRLISGKELTADLTRKARLTAEIFHEHRGVLFLGHFKWEEPHGGGWKLTPDKYLLMADLQTQLQLEQRGFSGGKCIPEVVFAGCCSGAWRDPKRPDRESLIYPKVFLRGGVKFFIGAWMDIVLPGQGCQSERDLMQRLISGFFRRWAKQPDDAISHLYETKKECGFHLLTSLYQIYTIPSLATEKATAPQAESIGVTIGDQLGDYKLIQEMWATSYAKTFWATSPAGNHLLQVLVDEWQGSPELPGKLQEAVRKLQQADLKAGHLVPSRTECVELSRGQGRRLQVMVFDCPAGEKSDAWKVLAPDDFKPVGSDNWQKVLHIGLEISARLVELHAKKIRHGNLDLNNILFHRGSNQEWLIVLKDAWVAQALPGRCTKRQYGAPEEMASQEGGEELKTDCWSMGVILFELATGESPPRSDITRTASVRPSIRETLGQAARLVPEALERVVRECLVPTPPLRPSAEMIERRFALSTWVEGGYVSKFEEELLKLERARQRLFAVWVDDRRELDPTLDGLDEAGYRIFIAAQGVGLVDRRLGTTLVEWMSKSEILREVGETSLQPLPVDGLNAFQILSEAADMLRQPNWGKHTPILLIDGVGWWNEAPAEIQLSIWRLLRLCQTEYHAPIIMVVDHWIPLEVELRRLFQDLPFPPLSPSDMFERVLAFPQTSGLALPPVDEQTAIELAQQLSPSTSRELNYALRLCALAYGVIDNRALEMRDAQREQFFRAVPGLNYVSLTKLPLPGALGLPGDLIEKLESWSHTTLNLLDGENVPAVPRRLLIEGPSGCGKTQLGLLLGRLTKRPVVRVDAARCLQGLIGESEREFRNVLGVVSLIPAAVVLLDDVDRFFGNQSQSPENQQGGVIARMSGIFEQWLDAMPLTTTVVLTSGDPGSLPPSWQRRIELRLNLVGPHAANSVEGIAYRQAIFAAVFRRAGLEQLATNHQLMKKLSGETLPSVRLVPSPLALADPTGTMRNHTSWLDTGADIENWVCETLLLHAASDAPTGPDFWLAKIKGEDS